MIAIAIIDALDRAQQRAGLSNRRLALAIGADPSSITQYKQGKSNPSLPVAMRWAEACGATLAVVEPRVAAVTELTGLAEDLTSEELSALVVAARALRETRDVPTKRPVIAACLSAIARQLDLPTDVPVGLLKA
jgi:transcriptional regulator with XRE-family HTH domain